MTVMTGDRVWFSEVAWVSKKQSFFFLYMSIKLCGTSDNKQALIKKASEEWYMLREVRFQLTLVKNLII